MKILVTGGAGFIGSHVADGYLADGHEVAVLDNLSTGFRRNVPAAARFYEADIRDQAALRRIMAEFAPEAMNHHAAQMDVRKSLDDPVFDADCNILGSLKLLIEAQRAGVRRIIYASTGGAMYGEPQSLPVDESHPVKPECAYGVSKHTVEHYLELYHRLYGLTYIVLRYPNVYGPHQSPHGEAGVNAIFIGMILEGITPTIFGDGEQLRDYVYVSDIVEANRLALHRGDNDAFHIGSGRGTSVNDIYRELSSILGWSKPATYAAARAGEIQRVYLNAQKAERVLGWHPTVSLSEGLRRTVEWHRRQRQAP